MQIGLIALGKMGANVMARLGQGGHQVVAYGRDGEVTAKVASGGPAPPTRWPTWWPSSRPAGRPG